MRPHSVVIKCVCKNCKRTDTISGQTKEHAEENAWKSGWYLGEEHSRAPEFNLCPRCYKKNVE